VTAIHQLVPNFDYGDAIGNHVRALRTLLRGWGYASNVYAQYMHPELARDARFYTRYRDVSDPGNVLLFHFSIGSELTSFFAGLPDRKVVIYHNITPPEYFVGVHKELVRQCFHGRRELTAYVSRCDLALGDSEYNREALDALGFAPTGVLPVVPDFSHLDVPPDRTLAGGFDDEWTNILFVGRVIPNKRFDDLIRAFHAYKALFNPRARLLLVGAHSGFERYLAQLYNLIGTLRTPDVHLVGHVSNEELTAFYDVADLFLCASEHEGFCVPLVESFYKGVPVVARAATAVPATMDGAGILYETRDPREVAALMHAVLDDPDLYDGVVAGQREALDRLRSRDFAGTLVGLVDRVLAGPRRAMPPVAFDFWQQFEMVDRMKALKRHRPSAFHALPPPPDSRPAASGRSVP